ncbi:MAG: T9SS type A sorting domain-containing protein [Lentimicrobiaceae bacterium]|nr:T9SS type A sorting domain-containing protein [Lentimicrobiaceae bacterium]
MKKLLLSIVSAFLLFALSAQVSDDFSDYTVGGKLAQQAQAMGRDYWDTWENQPGTAEDGEIAEQPAGNKVLFLNYGNDQILHLGKQTSGSWDLTFKIFIPTGKNGYFNVQANFTGSQSGSWACEIYFAATNQGPGTQGQGTIKAANITTPFTFQHETWLDVKINIDLDEDDATFYLGGNLVYNWVYSKGASGTQPGTSPRVIDAFNIFPPSNTATSSFYIDDVVFAPAMSVIFETNFDELAAGAYVAQSYPTWFETWENNPGTSEDALIVTEQAQTPPHSAKCAWGTDLVFMAGDRTSGEFTVDFDIYIPANGRAYFNLLQIFDRGNGGQDSQWAVGVYWNVTATGMPTGTNIRHNGINTPFTFSFNTWIPIHFYVNLDDDIASISINGEKKLEWQYSIDENGDAGVRQLAAVDFYPPQSGSVYYIDNFRFAGSGDGGVAIIDVTPTEINEIVIPGANVTKTVTVANTGTSMGDYYSWIQYDIPNPPPGTNTYNIAHCADMSNNSIGYTSYVGPIELGAKLFPSQLCGRVGSYITKLSYFLPINADLPSNNNKLIFRVYGPAGSNRPGELLSEGTITNPSPGAWNEITLSDPVLIDRTELWVTVELYHVQGAYPIAADGDGQGAPTVSGANWVRMGAGGGTGSFSEFNNWGNINIKATAQGGTTPGCWIALEGASFGTVAKNSSKTFNVKLNAAGLAVGTYTADIHVVTSDVENPLFVIPCTVNITSGPLMSVDVTEIFESIYIDGAPTSVTRPIKVSNNGNEPGNYEAKVEGTAAWLTLTGDVAATVPAGANKTFNAVLDAAGLEPDTYEATIVITTTDNNHPKFEIPCTLAASYGIDDFIIKTLVFPNPANDLVSLESNAIINSIQVFNNMGQLVYTANSVNSMKTTIDVANYTAGIYIMKIHTVSGSQNVKLIVR